MHITFAPRGHLQLDDVKILHRYSNFSGVADQYNREGDRSFCFLIDNEDDAYRLKENGWNVKIKPPREEGDTPFMYLKVKIKFNGYGPKVVLMTEGTNNRVILDEESIACLDRIDIVNVDMDISPYRKEVMGVVHQSAYLDTMYVTQRYNRFIDRYGE